MIKTDIYTALIIVFSLIFFAVVLLAYVMPPFIRSRRYLKLEIKRSLNDNERLYWKKQLHSLYKETFFPWNIFK